MKMSALVALGLLARVASAAVDPYVCYNTVPRIGGLLGFPPVNVVDAIEDRSYDMKARWNLCAPADVEGSGTTDPATYLVTFQLKRRSGEPAHQRVHGIQVANAVGLLTVDTIKPDHVLVPVSVGTTDFLPPPNPNTNGVDHYKCYRIKTSAGTPRFPQGTQVAASDQLSPLRALAIRKPRYLCAPASIDGLATKSPTVFQLCYLARPARDSPHHVPHPGLKIATKFPQYEPNVEFQVTLATVTENTVCIPSLVSLP
jgi:hypothetical protein